VIDLDASIVIAHSEKESAAPTFKGTFGYHPMLAFCDNSGEFLAGCCAAATPGPTPPPTTSRSLTPPWPRCPTRSATAILVRADTTGCTKAFLARLRALSGSGVSCEFSVGWAVNSREHDAIAAVP
jgi:hypothetical protein